MAADEEAVTAARAADRKADRRERPPTRMAGRAGDPVLWGIAAAVFATYTVLSVSRYVTGNPASWDLAIFTEAVKAYAHLRAPVVDIKGFDLLGDHFHPAMALLAPFFRVFPSPVTLLVGQALLTALSVVPVHRAAAHHLTVSEARIIAAAYGFSWGLASMNWSDVHEVAFAVPLVAGSLSAMVRGRPQAAVWWAMPLVFVKEDQGFTVAAIGIVLVVVHRERLAGAVLAVWGVAWSLLAVYVIIPRFNPHHVYPYWQDSGHLSTLATGLEVKIPTLVLILLPTALTALRSPVAAVAAPALGLRLYSSNHAYWGTGWHYSATAMPIVFVAAVDGLARIRQGRERTARSGFAWANGLGRWLGLHAPAMMIGITAALAVWSALSNLWQPGTYHVAPHIRAAQAAERMIPSGATVDATLGELAPLAGRDDVYFFNSKAAPDWILFDTAPGAYWAWNIPPTAPAHWFAGVSYRTAYVRDGVWLFEREPTRSPAPTARTAG